MRRPSIPRDRVALSCPRTARVRFSVQCALLASALCSHCFVLDRSVTADGAMFQLFTQYISYILCVIWRRLQAPVDGGVVGSGSVALFNHTNGPVFQCIRATYTTRLLNLLLFLLLLFSSSRHSRLLGAPPRLAVSERTVVLPTRRGASVLFRS